MNDTNEKKFRGIQLQEPGNRRKIRRVEEERTNHQQNEKKTNGKHGLYAVDIKRNK